MDYRWQEYQKECEARNKLHAELRKIIDEKIKAKECFCELKRQAYPFDASSCDICYEKMRLEIDQDLAADNADFLNKWSKENPNDPYRDFKP